MPPVLVLSSENTVAQQLLQALAAVGLAGEACADLAALRRQLGAEASPHAPRQIVLAGPLAPAWAAALLADGPGATPGPVSLVGAVGVMNEATATEALAVLLAQGLTGWWPASLLAAPSELATALALDRARWLHDTALRTELARAQGQLDERKWVDRAKGVLMSARGIGEDEAFRLLRGASMHANLRVGEVSRSVTEAAQWADAINRAGQLRMLSQRLLKLAAQRLAGVDARRARVLQDEATLRTQDNLDHLAALPMLDESAESPPGPRRAALASTGQAWQALRAALEQRQTPAALADADRQADALLAAAEHLTGALEDGAGRRALHIVNLCGRQRMRVQRLAKGALLAALLGEPARQQALVPLMDEVEAALLELEQTPLSSSEIRDTLAAAREEWLRLLRGLRGADGNEGRAALARSSDVLQDLFDRLTGCYEHSLQVIMS